MDVLLARQLRDQPSAAVRVPRRCRAAAENALTPPPLLEAFEVLFEAEGLPSYLLPFDLERVYGGIGFSEQVVLSNFVTSIDGVATLGDGRSAGSVISGHNDADRFLMGLLRACADAVLIGAGTLRATPGHLWTPAHVAPRYAESFAALRRWLGREMEPRLVVMTARGTVDPAHVAIAQGATFVTGEAGAERLAGRLPDGCDVVVAGSGEDVEIPRAVDELRRRGFDAVLTEGGPTVMGRLLEARIVDDAFLTLSPVLAGRDTERRPGMVDGVELLPGAAPWARLSSVRRHGDHLFLRYRLR